MDNYYLPPLEFYTPKDSDQEALPDDLPFDILYNQGSDCPTCASDNPNNSNSDDLVDEPFDMINHDHEQLSPYSSTYGYMDGYYSPVHISTPCYEEDEDNDKLNTSFIRIKYQKRTCCECKKKIPRINCFVLDKGRTAVVNEEDPKDCSSYICLDCSSSIIDDIHRLSDWEEEPELNGRDCYRCKKSKSAYRFHSNYCSYCSNKMKYRNKKVN